VGTGQGSVLTAASRRNRRTLYTGVMSRRAPRYDLPQAAPPPLRLVQQFVNTVNLESRDDWLERWLADQGVTDGEPAELDRARVTREALRQLLYANNGFSADGDPLRTLTAAAARAGFTIDFRRGRIAATAGGVDGVVGEVLAAAFAAMTAGTWVRLKACRNHHCRWAFYDYPKNRSASWCSMQLCGNRTKTRAYRRRQRA
jgi:predicted RNA-binding Zn ribbon-like protein